MVIIRFNIPSHQRMTIPYLAPQALLFVFVVLKSRALRYPNPLRTGIVFTPLHSKVLLNESSMLPRSAIGREYLRICSRDLIISFFTSFHNMVAGIHSFSPFICVSKTSFKQCVGHLTAYELTSPKTPLSTFLGAQ
ncbi:hypothetical protein NPIL_148661 [Nephila pilipes]|uniref:Uncharacterized protein n=1 Tax=Nephila pilipes TaxID=299642 RepID=A0A8X6PWV2_NEPPI|nr:hypothetical protein NPIL_148661 [Nephila pilipes]